MRLADQIIERASQPVTPVDRDLAGWVPKLRAASCFEVDATAGQLSHARTATNPVRTSIRTRSSIRLPAQLCWFEWLGASAGMGPYADEPPRPGTTVPHRSGVLVEVDPSLQRGLMSWVWSLPGPLLEPCPISIAFDWRLRPAGVPDVVRAAFASDGLNWGQHIRTVHDSSRFAAQDFEQFASEVERYGHIPCPGLPLFWSAMDILAGEDVTRAQDLCGGVLKDLEHEPIFLLGLIACLCAPGLLDVSKPPEIARLNAARRRRGRTELLSFRRISASARNVVRLSDRGGAVETMRGFHAA